MAGSVSFLKPQNFKTQLSAGKIMANVFQDSEGLIHADFLPHGVRIKAQYYGNFLHNDVHQMTWGNSEIILLHDNTSSYMAYLTKVKSTIGGWEMMTHLPHCPALSPSVILICFDQ
jgi:hypothetical protein